MLFSFPVCPNRTWIASWDRNALPSADREPWKEPYSNTTPAQGMRRHLHSFPEQTQPGHSRAARVYTSQWVTVLFNNKKKKPKHFSHFREFGFTHMLATKAWGPFAHSSTTVTGQILGLNHQFQVQLKPLVSAPLHKIKQNKPDLLPFHPKPLLLCRMW